MNKIVGVLHSLPLAHLVFANLILEYIIPFLLSYHCSYIYIGGGGEL